MRVLVTGGLGALGTALSALLIKQGHDVTVLGNQHSRERRNEAFLAQIGDFRCERGDIRLSQRRLLEYCRPDVVYHLAGQIDANWAIFNPVEDFEVNALGTVRLLEAVVDVVPKALFVYASTSKVYGGASGLVGEDTPLECLTPYACSKGTADCYVRQYHKHYGLQTVVLRHSCLAGGRQYGNGDKGFMHHFARQVISGEVMIGGNGEQVRDPLHVDDAARLYAMITPDMAGEVYNVGGGVSNQISINRLIGQYEGLLGQDVPVTHLPARRRDPQVFLTDNRKISNQLFWMPEIGITQLAKDVWEWETRGKHG